MIAMPNADSHNARVLQEDNTELAYECKLPRLKPRHTKPRHTKHASPCATCGVGSRAQVPGLHRREYTRPLNHARVHPRATSALAYTPPLLAQTSTPRASTRRAVALFAAPPP
jgi:hypothetical protein